MAHNTLVVRGCLIAALAWLFAGCSCDGLASMAVDDPLGGGSNDGSGEETEPVRPVVPGKAQLRLLNGDEYRNTVRDLMGLTASDSLPRGELASGYDTGSNARVDENTLLVYAAEAERLAGEYVATRIGGYFSCWNPADITDACIQEIITAGGAAVFRRPPDAAMVASLTAFFNQVAAETTDRRLATEFLIARMLSSPYFLYRFEVGQPDGDQRVLDAFERASLVSYGVTGSMPDAPLFADALAGKLDEANLRAHVRRLLETSAGKARVVTFMKQWLRVTAIDAMAESSSAYPKLSSPEQAAALRDEFAAYVTSVVFSGAGTLPALLGESHTFVNRHTAPLYGLTSDSETLARVSLDGAQRKGILTLASVMSAHGSTADATADRPVRRGLMVLNRLLCAEVGPPSGINTAAAASSIKAQYPNFDQLTVREQYEAMMEQGAECKSCHRQFMPLGFALGNFDALGRHVTSRFDRPINTSISDVALGGEAKSFPGAMALVDALAKMPQTSSCFARNYATFAIGTPSGAHLDDLALALAERFAAQGYDVRSLIEETYASAHLYSRRSE